MERLTSDSLYRATDPATLTASAAAPPPFVGQERAWAMLQRALADPARGHAILLAPPGFGRRAIAREAIRVAAARRKPPHDLLYLPRFDDPLRPQLLRLPAGSGSAFAAALADVIRKLPELVTNALRAESHRERVTQLRDRYHGEERRALDAISSGCEKEGLKLIATDDGWALVPIDRDGNPFSPEAFAALPEEERRRWESRVATWRERLAETLAHFPAWDEALARAIRAAERDALTPVASHLLTPLRETFATYPEAITFLEALERELLDGARPWLVEDDDEVSIDTDLLDQLMPHLLVGHEASDLPEVVMDEALTHTTLVGWIESEVVDGERISHHRHIRPGALVRAAEGFLILDGDLLLTDRDLWTALKKTLATGRIEITPPPDRERWGALPLLTPDPIPFTGQVVVIGTPATYETLLALDETFSSFFPWVIELEQVALRTVENEARYGALLRQLLADRLPVPVSVGAVARTLEEAARAAEDQSRLLLTVGHFARLLHEAAAIAVEAGRGEVTREDVEEAVAERFARTGRAWRETLEAICRGEHLIATSGTRVGQINGLVVFESGEIAYGHPMRITASVRIGGEGEVLDIERETELGGAIHSKGVMILAAFLSGRYGRRRPLALSATIALEQSYGFVEGDSASLAEALALLSAIAEVPLHQSIAVTGSINQFGEVQTVGAINEKIEGWFAVCEALGLDGSQGVVLPAANRHHLMLRAPVVEAVRAGRFHLWTVQTLDEAAAILTGLPLSGAQSLSAKVAAALTRMSRWHEEKGEGWRRPWSRRRE